MWDFLFWQILLSVSGVGIFLILLAMGTDARWWPGLLPLVVVSACMQLFPIIFYVIGQAALGQSAIYPSSCRYCSGLDFAGWSDGLANFE